MLNLPTLPVSLLSVAARTLGLVGGILERVADTVRPDPRATSAPPARRPPAPVLATVPRPADAATAPADGTAVAGLVPFDASRLVRNPAPVVVEAVADLSTEQLGELYDAERSARRRRTVVLAIENALLPPASAVRDRDADPVEDGAGSRLAYSTQTPNGGPGSQPV